MRIYRYPGQIGIIIGKFQARIARHQQAVWWDYRPIINRVSTPGHGYVEGFWNWPARRRIEQAMAAGHIVPEQAPGG